MIDPTREEWLAVRQRMRLSANPDVDAATRAALGPCPPEPEPAASDPAVEAAGEEHCPTCGGAVEVATADEGTSSFRPVDTTVTDEMVERAARAVHEVSDDVLPFDLHVIEGMGRRDERVRQNRIDVRERYLTTARAALEAALGNAA